MKSIFMGATMLALPIMLTSCEGTLDDVFGQWDRPSKIPAEVFMFKKVLDEGATLTVSFKLNDSDASVTFKKEGDVYKVTSSTLSADNFSFNKADVIDEDVMVLSIGDIDNPDGQIFFKAKDGSYFILNNIDGNITFDGKVSVNGISGSVTNNCPDKMLININTDADKSTFEKNLIVYYNKANSETWKDVAKRYDIDKLGGVLFAVDGDRSKVNYDDSGAVSVAVACGTNDSFVNYLLPTDTNKVKISDKIGFKDADAFAGPYYADCPPT